MSILYFITNKLKYKITYNIAIDNDECYNIDKLT